MSNIDRLPSTVIGDEFATIIQGKNFGPKVEDLKELGLRARVLFALLERLEYGNVVWETGSSLARVLGTSPMVVNVHLAYFSRVGLLKRGKVDGYSVIHLNEDFFWKGDRAGRVIAKRQSARARRQPPNGA